ncbi:uncharacterized protein [Aristolochia californica]|uniref:uncharacterized protein isoform X2 n=1 Tax=Aristolochia californica TaxID=171875 RepID=UPI0035DB6A05
MAFLAMSLSPSPSSFQLRLGFRSKSYSYFRFRMNCIVVNRFRVRASSAAGSASRDGSERDSIFQGTSWASSEKAADSFSGWLDKDDDDSMRMGKFGGIVGAGLAAMFLVAGVAFASVSLKQRSNSGLKLQMEPLTSQQEELVVPEGLNGNLDKLKNESKAVLPDEGNLQNDCIAESKEALQVPPGKVVVPAVIDNVQGQALAALQVLKVIEADVQPGDLCTRREYARWLVSASSILSRNSTSKVYPAMYIENISEVAFDDVAPEDPDFPSIQGLAEAGLISSKLSKKYMNNSSDGDQGPFLFSPESPLSRQDLVSWKIALEKKHLPQIDKQILCNCSGFLDIDRINPDAWPALVADITAGEQGIIPLAFGYTRLFQPEKPVTKAQAAIALATGDSTDVVGEELARIEAEAMAETAVAAHTTLVAQVERDINANFEKELAMERKKIEMMGKLAEEARQESSRLRAEREEQKNAVTRSRASVESEIEVLSRLRCELEEQLESLMYSKAEVVAEKERINKLRKEGESENKVIAQLQYELEVERKALSMARAWAEDEARRAREQAKALEEARGRWESLGLKVVVEDDLRGDIPGDTWINAGESSESEKIVIDNKITTRAENLVAKLKVVAGEIKLKSSGIIENIIQKIEASISSLRHRAAEAAMKAGELQGVIISKSAPSVEELRHNSARFTSNARDGVKRIAGDCREGMMKFSQKFKE